MVIAQVERPFLTGTNYDVSQCLPGIVHLGYGAFHRAHQAVYVDDYMQATGDLRWGIVGVNLRASESKELANAAQSKQGYLLKTVAPNGEVLHRLVRSHVALHDWSVQAEVAERVVAKPTVHMLSLTVTESGYFLNDDFSLNTADPVIAAEIDGGASVSVYAFLANALKWRMQADGGPLNILCCDNMRRNGKVLANNFSHYLHCMGDADLKTWVESNVAFPCSMVDRITPRSTDALKQSVIEQFGPEHQNPVHAEAFSQWVLQDHFKAPMPDFSQVGVELVDDIDPYEEAKIRILNGGHTGVCYLGALAGYQTVDQSMADPAVRAIFDGFEQQEVLPGLDFDLLFDKQAYLEKIAARFCNASLPDALERICMDGMSKIPIYIRPTLASCLKQGIEPHFTLQCIASWYVFARRFAAGKMHITYHEPYWHVLEPLLEKGAEAAFARAKLLWADLPERYPAFAPALQVAIEQMELQWPV